MAEQFAIFRLTKAQASGEYAGEVRRNGRTLRKLRFLY